MNSESEAANQREGEAGLMSDQVEGDALASSPRHERHENGAVHDEGNDPMESSELVSSLSGGNDAYSTEGLTRADETVPHAHDHAHDHDHDHDHDHANPASETNNDAFR